jgi:hypothetical protein
MASMRGDQRPGPRYRPTLLDLAWRNTTSIDDDTRIVAVYSGFEVLLDKEGAAELRKALSVLVDPPGAPTTSRPIPKRPRPGRRSEIRPEAVTDLEWWFTFFAFLRHDITHGNEIQSGQNLWNRNPHLFLGEAWLRQAIKQTVANAGYPDVLLDPLDRVFRRAAAALLEE